MLRNRFSLDRIWGNMQRYADAEVYWRGLTTLQLFHGGVMFECVRRDDRHNKRDKPYEVLAYGGR